MSVGVNLKIFGSWAEIAFSPFKWRAIYQADDRGLNIVIGPIRLTTIQGIR